MGTNWRWTKLKWCMALGMIYFRKLKMSSFFLVMNVKDHIKGNFYFAFIFHFIILQTLWECLEYS